MAQSHLHIDIAALLLHKGFLQAQKLYFQGNCSHDYSEGFIHCCPLSDTKAVRVPITLERCRRPGLWQTGPAPAGREIFQAIETMLRAQAVIGNRCPDDRELCESSEERKSPETVMDYVDVLLCEGLGYNTTRGYLRIEGYGRLSV